MTAFLTQQGTLYAFVIPLIRNFGYSLVELVSDLNPSLIGGFSGLCAFMGVAATFISARLVQKFGILKVSFVNIYF